jgi:hypothetical protein
VSSVLSRAESKAKYESGSLMPQARAISSEMCTVVVVGFGSCCGTLGCCSVNVRAGPVATGLFASGFVAQAERRPRAAENKTGVASKLDERIMEVLLCAGQTGMVKRLQGSNNVRRSF